jgi:hypothetical protein
MIYVLNTWRVYKPPSTSYFNTILRGYESAGFDTEILYEAAERAGNTMRKEKKPMNHKIDI